MFEEICSIYKSATDAHGDFVDMETGECIQQMSIREFCLTDRWKPYVEKLRAMRQQYGSKAKKMPEYIETKKMLPGATLSGLFSLYEDESLTHPGQRVMVSRRETHLQQHTGWLAIDIDLQDNQQLTNFENIRMVARFRPEIGLLMRSVRVPDISDWFAWLIPIDTKSSSRLSSRNTQPWASCSTSNAAISDVCASPHGMMQTTYILITMCSLIKVWRQMNRR